jgi:hypothetical protein
MLFMKRGVNMQSSLVNLTYEVELRNGEVFLFPEEVVKQITPGKWWISIRPVPKATNGNLVRGHDAFLNSYTDDDEGLYDDYPTR